MIPRLLFLLIFVITLSNCTKEVVQAPQKSFFEILNAHPDSAVEITVTTALTDLLEERSSTYQEAQLDIQLSDGTFHSLHAQLKTRGQTRKKICDFPPLKLKITEESLIQNNWDTELSSYKLVTDCIGNKDLVAKEIEKGKDARTYFASNIKYNRAPIRLCEDGLETCDPCGNQPAVRPASTAPRGRDPRRRTSSTWVRRPSYHRATSDLISAQVRPLRSSS